MMEVLPSSSLAQFVKAVSSGIIAVQVTQGCPMLTLAMQVASKLFRLASTRTSVTLNFH